MNAPRPMKFPPLDPSRPVTNKQLAEQNQRLHDCLHNVGERVDKLAEIVANDRDENRNRDQLLEVKLARVEGKLGIKAGDKPGKPSFVAWGHWKVLGWFAAAMGGVQITYQILVPALIDFFVTLHQRLMGG